MKQIFLECSCHTSGQRDTDDLSPSSDFILHDRSRGSDCGECSKISLDLCIRESSSSSTSLRGTCSAARLSDAIAARLLKYA